MSFIFAYNPENKHANIFFAYDKAWVHPWWWHHLLSFK